MDELVRELFDELRSRIDALDRQTAQLMEERMQVVARISELKAKHGISVLDAGREKSVLANVTGALRNHELDPYITDIYNHIMAVSRNYQKSRIHRGNNGPAQFGLLGERLSHSISPAIHDALFARHGMDARYSLVEMPKSKLPTILDELRRDGYRGLNVTIPYKKDIMLHLDAVSEEAVRIGAVNTIVLGERSTGYNTDYQGFGLSLERYHAPCKGARCAVLGSGGASRSVVAWLEDNGAASITIVSRDADAAAMKFPGLFTEELEGFQANGFDLIVNTTPVGMYPHGGVSPLRADQLTGAGFVMDLIYNPATTQLMKDATALGIPTANGLYMLIAQAVQAESIWHGTYFSPEDVEAIYTLLAKE